MRYRKPGGNASKMSLNGPDTTGGQTALSGVLHEVHKNLLRNAWAMWKLTWWNVQSSDKESEVDQVKYTRVSIVTLTQVAATCAVDVGLTEEKFIATCKANYTEALKNAPRWG